MQNNTVRTEFLMFYAVNYMLNFQGLTKNTTVNKSTKSSYMDVFLNIKSGPIF